MELVNNLGHEHQTDAWLDLAQIPGERQRVSGQLVQAIEGAAVLLAGASQFSPSSGQPHSRNEVSQTSEEFVKVTENVLVTIRSLPVQAGDNNQQQVNRSIEVAFPSETSTLGTSWMNNEQRFTLHLQVTPLVNNLLEQSQVDVKYPQLQEQADQSLGKFLCLSLAWLSS